MSFLPDLNKIEDLEFFYDEPDPISDVFGYHRFCENFVSIISKQKDTPFSILINGEWGSGKTSVLVKTRQLLKELENKDDTFKAILFEVWKYEKIDPVASLLEEINNTIKGKNSTEFAETVKSVGLLLFDMAIRAHTHLTLKEATEYFDKSHKGIRNLRAEMETLMEGKKLVILFDDLDRCSFETMLELVEAIRLFLSVKGVICVVAADNERLRAAWRNKYAMTNENEPDEYFDKIFQLKLALPNKEQVSINEFINDLKPSYIGEREKILIIASTTNPRKIKQILNLIFFGLKYSKLSRELSQDNLSSYYPIIVAWTIISVLYPALGHKIKKHPESLNEILDFISLIRFSQENIHNTYKIKMEDEELAENVFKDLQRLPTVSDTHYLKIKSDSISIWSLDGLEMVREDFDLFSLFWDLLSYLAYGIVFPAKRTFRETIKFVESERVNEVVNQFEVLI